MTSTSSTAQATQQRALVVGLGISGIASAIALHQAGWHVTVVERSAERRRGGYFIGLFGMGRHAAGRLGVLDGLHDRRTAASKNFAADREGITGETFGFGDAPDGLAPWMMLRGDVERAAFEALPDDVEIRYGTTPERIFTSADAAVVELRDAATGDLERCTYDLVVGADGIRSSVRRLVFGPDERYLHETGTNICAFELPENPPGLDQEQGVIFMEPGRSLWIFPFSDHRPTALFAYTADDSRHERTLDPRVRLREVFGEQPGTFVEFALDALDRAEERLFDATEQVRMDRWHQGRVVLVGDAAWCPTLYSGMGATSGIAGAEHLGRALGEHPGDVAAALEAWETSLRPHIERFQEEGVSGRTMFLAKDEGELRARTLRTSLMRGVMRAPGFGRMLGRAPMFRRRNLDLAA